MTRVREWRPGDVGTSQYGRVFNTDRGWVFDDDSGYTSTNKISGFRPLVVVDPDSDDVERLAQIYAATEYVSMEGVKVPMSAPALRMQAALREFADPKPPKPEEPTGLGAVVEDVDGVKWVRSGTGSTSWHSTVADWVSYARIDAVEVLSDGIPA